MNCAEMAKKRQLAPQRADTRGRPWAGIPHAVLDSAAYIDLTLFARAVLTEVVLSFTGSNNGEIAVPYSRLMRRLSNKNKRKIAQAFAELMSHGFVTTEADADWKGKRAREYRLTFANTTPGGRHKPATNDYKDWVKPVQKAGITWSPVKTANGDHASPVPKTSGDASSPDKFEKLRNTRKNTNPGSPLNGDASLPHINTIPLEEKTEAQKRIHLAQPHDKDSNGAPSFDSTVRAQISTGWSALSSLAKIKLAQRHGVSEREMDSYIRGEQQFSAAKLMAIRSDLLPRW